MKKTARKAWSAKDYATAAKKLRKAGFNVSAKPGQKATGHQKAAVHRLWNQNKRRVQAYLNPANGFKFVPMTSRQAKKLKRLASKEQMTPGGMFFQTPKGTDPDDISFRVDGDRLEVSANNRRDVIVRLDPELLAIDPDRAVREAIGDRKPAKVSLMVNGFRGKTEYAMKSFFQYFDGPGISGQPSLMDQLRDDERSGGPLDDEQIADIFSLRLIYGRGGRKHDATKAKKSKGKARPQGRSRAKVQKGGKRRTGATRTRSVKVHPPASRKSAKKKTRKR